MTLRERQSLFVQLLAKLFVWAKENGYELTLGEGWRTPEMVEIYTKRGTGSPLSLHPLRLAQDLNLFKNGKWLTATEDHRPLGEYWKSLHPDNRWGGDFSKRKDGNHYENCPPDKKML